MSQAVQLTPGQRAAAVERLGDNLALRSGAGCGKTLVLARRFTELLMASRGKENPLERLVAVTFTEKAALEMRQRVRKFLAEAASSTRSREDRKLLRQWLDELPEARISTIHGFCASVLRAHAVEAGVDPNFAVCGDDLLAARMRLDAAERAVIAAAEAGEQDAAELLAELSFEKLVSLVVQLMEWRAGCDLRSYGDADRIIRQWRTCRDAAATDMFGRMDRDDNLRELTQSLAVEECTSAKDKLLAIRDQAVALARRLLEQPEARTPETFSLLASLSPRNFGSDKAWPGVGAKEIRDRIKSLKSAFEQYGAFAEQIGEADEQAAARLASMARLAIAADDLYTAEKTARSLLDFTDLLYRTDRLLRANESLRKTVASSIDQLLIDECQDTNAQQLRMLLWLLFGADDVREADEGRLFVVGDAKQSIYRFRGAQVEVFEDLCRQLGPGRREALDTSFRTHTAGAEFINHLFGALMGGDYEPIKVNRTHCPPGPAVEIIIAGGPADEPVSNARQAAAAQAAAVARRIRDMIDSKQHLVWDAEARDYRPATPGDIAILFTRMTVSDTYERQLGRRGIPYYVVAGTGFYRRQEVYDVLNALGAIDNPFDDVAFIGALRSAMFGLDDNALMHIADECERPYLPTLGEKLTEEGGLGGLSAEQNEALRAAVEVLGLAARKKDAVGIAALIEDVLAATAYEATLLSQAQGKRMLGNVRRLLQLARQATASKLTLAQFITQMSRRVADQSRSEQAAVAGEGEDVVRLMTIHKAKGLQFPIVFIPDLSSGRRGCTDSLINRLDWGLTYKHAPNGQENDSGESRSEASQPASYRLARAAEDLDQQREDIRKLYVAATRHEDHLVLVAADWRDRKGRFSCGRRPSFHINRIDDVLSIGDALDAGLEEIPYAGGRFTAALLAMETVQAPRLGGNTGGGRKLPAGDICPARLAKAVAARSGKEPPELLGPLAATVSSVEVAVTALSDFAHCPMLYRWRHELRIGQARPSAGGKNAHSGPVDQAMDPATAGTLLHRCMELLDFADPQPAENLLRQASGQMGLEEQIDVQALASELAEMLKTFKATGLFRSLARSPVVYRELDFVMDMGPATIRGQIDSLHRDADGSWRIVDYKSDRIEPGRLAAGAERYRMQLMLYAVAAGRHLGRPPGRVEIYFLRAGRSHEFATAPKPMKEATARAARLVAELIGARRSGSFRRRQDNTCTFCPYEPLCLRHG